MAIFQELPIAFPCYQKKEYQNRFKQNVAGRHDLPAGYKAIDLICPFDALLPTQFYVPLNLNLASWGIYKAESDTLVRLLNTNLLNTTSLPGVARKYIYHDGRQQNFTLASGTYYLRFDFTNGFKEYSEVFQVCDFSVNRLDCPFLKLEWWNNNDLEPIFYNDKTNGKPRFRNIVYLDTFIHEYEPLVTVETKPGGKGTVIPTFSKGTTRYKINFPVPGYLQKALVYTQLHDNVYLTTSGIEHRTGKLEEYQTDSPPLLNGAFAEFTLSFEEIFISKTSCPNNMV